jgi:hypothetical protein
LTELTRQDLDDLIDAVESWETAGQSGEMVADLLGAVIVSGDANPRTKAEIEKAAKERKRRYEIKTRLRKDRSIMLRAKLIQIRDGVQADALLRDALREIPSA